MTTTPKETGAARRQAIMAAEYRALSLQPEASDRWVMDVRSFKRCAGPYTNDAAANAMAASMNKRLTGEDAGRHPFRVYDRHGQETGDGRT